MFFPCLLLVAAATAWLRFNAQQNHWRAQGRESGTKFDDFELEDWTDYDGACLLFCVQQCWSSPNSPGLLSTNRESGRACGHH